MNPIPATPALPSVSCEPCLQGPPDKPAWHGANRDESTTPILDHPDGGDTDLGRPRCVTQPCCASSTVVRCSVRRRHDGDQVPARLPRGKGIVAQRRSQTYDWAAA